MKKEKLEQLKKVFKTMIGDVIKDVKKGMNINSEYVVDVYSEAKSKEFLYEVKIRINNKKG